MTETEDKKTYETELVLTLKNGRTVRKALPGIPKDDVEKVLRKVEGDGALYLTTDPGKFIVIYPAHCAAIEVYEIETLDLDHPGEDK